MSARGIADSIGTFLRGYVRGFKDPGLWRVYLLLGLAFIAGWEFLILGIAHGRQKELVVGLECLAPPLLVVAVVAWLWKRGEATMSRAKHRTHDE